MRGDLARGFGSLGAFVLSLVLMVFACIWAWDGFVNGKLYYCTDGGGLDFLCVGDWVHHPEPVAHVVPRSMNQPDEIKDGWSIGALWRLWGMFVAVSVLTSIVFARSLWTESSPGKPRQTTEATKSNLSLES
ncbi:MAG TPA: hypothetical protein VNH84_17650 [Candidatus Saccharimonadales bacterium]|nr:hypothetical protein [Candidatus Saccharimonadales bacterium]